VQQYRACGGEFFYLNTSVGWVLLARGDENDEVQFDQASTEDSCLTWRVSHIEISNRMPDDLSGYGSMYFLNRLHGWMNQGINSSSAFRPGKMLETAASYRGPWRRGHQVTAGFYELTGYLVAGLPKS
jgi:hypothetical protein